MLCQRYIPAVLLFAMCAVSAADDKNANLKLEITTKLGVQTEAVVKQTYVGDTNDGILDAVGALQHSFQSQSAGHLTMHLGEGVHILIPWPAIKQVTAEKKTHVVTLTDDSTYTGTIITSITTTDDLTYSLSAASKFTITNATPLPKNSQSEKVKTFRLTVAPLKDKPLDVSFVGFCGVARSDSGFQVSKSPRNFGQSFTIDVEGERLDGNFSSFDKFILEKSKDKGWTLTIQAPNGPEISGQFNAPGYSGGGIYAWALAFKAQNGCIFALIKPETKVTVTSTTTKTQSP